MRGGKYYKIRLPAGEEWKNLLIEVGKNLKLIFIYSLFYHEEWVIFQIPEECDFLIRTVTTNKIYKKITYTPSKKVISIQMWPATRKSYLNIKTQNFQENNSEVILYRINQKQKIDILKRRYIFFFCGIPTYHYNNKSINCKPYISSWNFLTSQVITLVEEKSNFAWDDGIEIIGRSIKKFNLQSIKINMY